MYHLCACWKCSPCFYLNFFLFFLLQIIEFASNCVEGDDSGGVIIDDAAQLGLDRDVEQRSNSCIALPSSSLSTVSRFLVQHSDDVLLRIDVYCFLFLCVGVN